MKYFYKVLFLCSFIIKNLQAVCLTEVGKSMIKSMTGFGRSEQLIDGREISVEIKSVNHRYFEFSCRTTRGYSFLEEKVKSYVSGKISRGKVDVYVSVGSDDERPSVVKVNHNLAQGYVNALQELSITYSLTDDTTVSSIAKYNDVFTVRKTPEDEDEIWGCVVKVLDEAIANFVYMREIEGEKMQNDICMRANTILDYVSEIEEKSPKTVEEYRNKLTERMKEVLNNTAIDENKILIEAAVYADKVAVDEETVRLRSHFEQLNKIMKDNGAVGRKIDFILQEMNRETNTIGSKVQNAELAHVVVDMKAELEKIREQVQNIE